MLRGFCSSVIGASLFLAPASGFACMMPMHVGEPTASAADVDWRLVIEEPEDIDRIQARSRRFARDYVERHRKQTLGIRQTTANRMKTYHSKEAGFSIGYPKTWSVSEGFLGTIVTFASPNEGKDDATTENVNVTTETLGHDITTLGDYTDYSLESLDAFMPQFTLLESGQAKLGGHAARAVTFTTLSDDVALQFKQVWTVRDSTAYVLTFVATPESFAKHVRHFHLMVRSFMFED